MALGLLGGLALAFGGKSLLDWQAGQRAEKAQQRNLGLLAQADQIYGQNPLIAVDMMRQAGLEKPEIDQRVQTMQQMQARQQFGPYESAIEQQEAAGKLRGEREKKLAPFAEARDQYQNLMTSLQLDTGPAGVASVMSFMKALDPRSVVRGDEFDVARQSGGMFDSVVGWINKTVSGKTELGPAARYAIAEVMTAIMNGRLGDAQRIAEQYDFLAEQGQIDPRMIRSGVVGQIPEQYTIPESIQALRPAGYQTPTQGQTVPTVIVDY